MKKYFLFLCLFFPAITHAAIAFVTSTGSGATSTATFISATSSFTNGNLIVIECRHGTTYANPTSATSTGNPTVNLFANASNTATGMMTGYYFISNTTGVTTTTCNFASSVSNRNIAVMQYSGTDTTSPLDTTSTAFTDASVTAFPTSTGKYTTANANDVLVSFIDANTDGSITSVTSSWTSRFLSVGAFGTGGADQITSTIQTNQGVMWAFSASPAIVIVGAFKAASTAAIPTSDVTIIDSCVFIDSTTII